VTSLDFTPGTAVLIALIAAALFPAVLAGLARLPRLRDRSALQFLASCVLVVGFWGIALLAQRRALAEADVAASCMILAGVLIVYLEAWALLSGGYTLTLLLTLFQAGRPMTDTELAAGYRRGQGLGWIMHHRLGRLISARLVRRQGDRIVLTFAGALIARAYRVAIVVVGLEITG
jgi:hypothetical protein